MIKVVNFGNFFKKVSFFIMIFILIIIIFFLKKNSSTSFIESNHEINTVFYSCLNDVLPPIYSLSNENTKITHLTQFILYSEFPILNTSLLQDTTVSDNSSISSDFSSAINQNIDLASGALSTESIDSGVPNTYTNDYNGVQVKNSSTYELTYEMLDPSNLTIKNENIIIFHTHTCESYTQSESYQYEESGNYRTIDLERSVSKVGSVLTDYLLHYGFNVIHNTTYHDYPSYNGSYGRSMDTVQSILSDNPNTDVIIDIHRDAIADETYAPSVRIGDETVSQLMFVIGTDGGGLEHPNWVNNLKFAVKVQEKANELYPGLFKPIILRNSRYNQQLGNAACIIEVGATGNTLEQSIGSMKYLSYVLNEILKN